MDLALRETLGINCSRRCDDSLNVVRQLGFRPDGLIDAEVVTKAVATAARPEKIVARHEAYRLGRAESLGNRAGDNVDLVKARARDGQVARFDVGNAEDAGTCAAAEHEADIKSMETVRGGRIVIDNVKVVVGGKRSGKGVANFPTAYDDDTHRLTQFPFWHPRCVLATGPHRSGCVNE